jgi:hypothetical protein
MTKIHMIRGLQFAEIAVLAIGCAWIYYETGKIWIALVCGLLAIWSAMYGGMVATLDLKPQNKDAHTMKVTAADVKRMLTLRVKVARSIAPRMWLGTQVIKLAAFIGGFGLKVEVVNENDAPTVSATH